MKFEYILYGVGLSLATAITSIFYERLLKTYGLTAIATEKFIEGILFFLILRAVLPATTANFNFVFDKDWWLFLGAVTIPVFWFLLTWKYNVMVGTIYEISYIIPLTILYIFLGTQKLTLTFIIGVILVICGLIVISL